MKFETISFKDLLSEIIDNRGKTCPTVEEGIPLIATNCVNNNTLYPTYEKIRFVSEDTYENWFRGHPEPGDILFVTKGSPGRCNFVPEPVEFCIAQDMVSIRADEDKIDPKFLFALLRSPQVQHQIGNMHVGSLIPHFKKGDFDKLFLEIPTDRVYQKKVGEQYFTFSQKIHLNRQTNETLEAMAQAIFKSWFVDFDPVRAKIKAKSAGRDPKRAAMAAISACTKVSADGAVLWDETEAALDQKLARMTEEQRQQLKRTAQLFPDELEESEIGEVPKGWEVRTAEEILKRFRAPKRVKKDDVEETGEVVVLEQGEGIIMGYHNQKAGFNASPDNPHFIFGDHTCITHLVIEPFDIAPNVIPLQGEEFDSYWTYYAIRDLQQFQEYRRHWRELKVKEVVTPNYELDELFAEFIKPLIIKINKNRNENLTLSQLRDTLLPKLISGEVGV